MNLVMFDIDGTLTDTTCIDKRCYIQSIHDVLQIYEIDTDVENYSHITDEGITTEIIERHSRTAATKKKLSDVRNYFFRLLCNEAADNPDLIRPLPGAVDMIKGLSRIPNQAISLATGGWRAPADFKIRFAGFDLSHTPIATSSDAVEREEIMRLSEARARRAYGVESFESIVYVGDGVWDLRSADVLGYHFIGIGTGNHASRLIHEGAVHIISDFTDRETFFGILELLQKRSGAGGKCAHHRAQSTSYR